MQSVKFRGWPLASNLQADWAPSGLDYKRLPSIYTISLEPQEVLAVDEALQSFKGLGIHGDNICQSNFRLPATLKERLRQAAIEIHQEKGGLCLVRGLDPCRYNDEDNLLVFLGMASYIGDRRAIQDHLGNVVAHITDVPSWELAPNQRHGIHTNQSLAFHSDMGADILALHVRQSAWKGGSTYVSRSLPIYNDLAANHPKVLELLKEPCWPIQVTGFKTNLKFVYAPLVNCYEGKVMMNLDPGRLGVHPVTAARRTHKPSIPALTSAQVQALGVVSEVASKHRMRIDGQAGDMLFLNNWAVLHARDSYVDDGNKGHRRHLVRLWIRNSEFGWKVPENMRVPWNAAYGHDDDTYAASDQTYRRVLKRQYAVVPDPVYKPPKYTAGSAAFVLEDSDDETEEQQSSTNGKEKAAEVN